jgi:hypothetical protein
VCRKYRRWSTNLRTFAKREKGMTKSVKTGTKYFMKCVLYGTYIPFSVLMDSLRSKLPGMVTINDVELERTAAQEFVLSIDSQKRG